MYVSPIVLGVFKQCLSILVAIYSVLRFAVINSEKGPEWEMDLLGDDVQWCCNSLFASGDTI